MSIFKQLNKSSPAPYQFYLLLFDVLSNKKTKKSSGPPADNLCSHNWEVPPPSKHATPVYNQFDALASDDNSIPSIKSSNKQFTKLSTSISDMTNAFNKKFDSIFGVLTTHH